MIKALVGRLGEAFVAHSIPRRKPKDRTAQDQKITPILLVENS
jgi:hypothetical protein